MKKWIFVVLGVLILIVIIGIFVLKKSHFGDIVDGPGMENGAAFYGVDTEEILEFPGESIYFYDENGNLLYISEF